MIIVDLINRAMVLSTAEAAARAMVECLSRYDDISLFGLLIEEEGDKEVFITELKKYLQSREPEFVDRVFFIFRTILKTKSLEDTLAKIKQRPALVRAADYVMKLYDEYASSKELLNRVAMTKGDLNQIRSMAFPELPAKDVGLPKDFIDAMTNTVTREIERFSYDFVDGPGRQLLANSYKWTDSPEVKDPPKVKDSAEVTDDDIEAATGEPPVATNVRSDAAKPRDKLTEYLRLYKTQNSGNSGWDRANYSYLKKLKALDAASGHYYNTLRDAIRGVASSRDYEKIITVYKYQGGELPYVYQVKDLISELTDPRTTVDQDWAATQTIIGLSKFGPFYSLADLLGLYFQSADWDPKSIDTPVAIRKVIAALKRLSDQVMADAAAVRPDKIDLGG